MLMQGGLQHLSVSALPVFLCQALAQGCKRKSVVRLCNAGPDPHKRSRADLKSLLKGDMRPSCEDNPDMLVCAPDVAALHRPAEIGEKLFTL